MLTTVRSFAPIHTICPAAAQLPFGLHADKDQAVCPIPSTSLGYEGLQAWQLAGFEPVLSGPPRSAWACVRDLCTALALQRPAGQVRASALLRGEDLEFDVAPPGPGLLQAQATAARGILADYARHAGSQPVAGSSHGEPPARPQLPLAGLADGDIDILLAARSEFVSLVREATGEPLQALARVVFLEQPPRVLVDADRFFEPGTAEPGLGAIKDLLRLVVQPQLHQLLQPAQHLLGLRRGTLERALHRELRGEPAQLPEIRIGALSRALVRGDGAGVVRAVLPASFDRAIEDQSAVPEQVNGLTAGSAVPTRSEAGEALVDAVAQALADEPPRTAAARQLVRLLGPKARSILEQASMKSDPEALRRLAVVQAVGHANAVARAALAPALGAFDVLADCDFDVQFAGGARRFGQQLDPSHPVAGDLLRVPGVLRMDDNAALFRGVASPRRRDPVLAGLEERGLGRALRCSKELGAETFTLYLPRAPWVAKAFEYRVILQQLLGAYHGAVTDAAAVEMARASLPTEQGGLAVPLAVLDTLLVNRLAGEAADDPQAWMGDVARRLVAGRALREQVPDAQAERDLLRVVFSARSFGTLQDLAAMERLTRDVAAQLRQDETAARGGTLRPVEAFRTGLSGRAKPFTGSGCTRRKARAC